MEKTIAFDTSNRALSVALFEDERLLFQIESNLTRNHSSQLLPDIDQALKSVDWQPADLTQVIVSQGPGSYTGLRIGVTTAKTLAFTLGIGLTGISSLALLATNVDDPTALIIPVMDARNQNLYAGAYRWQDGHLVQVLPDQHTHVKGLIDQVKALTEQPVVVVGEWQSVQADLSLAWSQLRFAQDNLPHASHSLILAADATSLTDMTAIHQFVPNYHRLSQAEADWAQAHPGASNDGYVEKI
ncbi:tRNA (adenosine(37)-N6)-threonylcarbamoyltransferase complex dimerization subunit type 1 TsaB [Weissella halotolerans]|uniref:M22 family O-sialoglycoprotein endopeptidase n=1 Tax=Weissella halotolerans DSM 20190 TaxID=1123500 RepID=A0A0R2G4A9_9LACO|nr:tRNA (adenosine(37)-N6)-threonylcarbamoyltransferase complex dimerization subunit type 1 TsaB [Weissella halotolerans]KRN32311.1 M22 family O-sialoglycoprotein endopeptidase [Weissella halotolerans DSM 20190]